MLPQPEPSQAQAQAETETEAEGRPDRFVHVEPTPDHPETGGRTVACTCHPGRRG